MRHISDVSRDMADNRHRLRKVITKHYGAGYTDSVLDMLIVGSDDYCEEVMQEWYWTSTQQQMLVEEFNRIKRGES